MPRGKGKSTKTRDKGTRTRVREFIEPDNKCLYLAQLKTAHGGAPPRFTCETPDGETFIAPLQNSIKSGPKRQIARVGDWVLCLVKECSSSSKTSVSVSGKDMVIHHIYDKNEIKNLKSFMKTVKSTDDDAQMVKFEDDVGGDEVEKEEEIDISAI